MKRAGWNWWMAALLVGAWSGSATAAPATRRSAPRKPAAKSLPSSEAQADGILGAVVERLWDDNDAYWHNGRYEDLIAVNYVLVQLEPDFMEAYSNAAYLIDSNGRAAEAVQLLTRATAAMPDRWEAWGELGELQFRHKQYREAVAALEKAAADPQCWIKHLHTLGHAYRLLGDPRKSLAAWEKAHQRSPDDPVVKIQLERARAAVAQQP